MGSIVIPAKCTLKVNLNMELKNTVRQGKIKFIQLYISRLSSFEKRLIIEV